MAAEGRGENTCCGVHLPAHRRQTNSSSTNPQRRGHSGLGELQSLGRESSWRFSTRFPLKLAAEASDMDQPTENELLSHLYQKI